MSDEEGGFGGDPADPALNPGGDSDVDSNSGKHKGSGSGSENDPDDEKRNQVRKEFTLDFEKKIAKYIPPKIKFKGDISKRKEIKSKQLEGEYASPVIKFNKYFVYFSEGHIRFLKSTTLDDIYQEKISGEKELDVFGIFPLDDEHLLIISAVKTFILKFKEESEGKYITETLQEFKNAKFFAMGEKLSNGYLLLAGEDRTYYFFDLEDPTKPLSKTNLYKLKGSVEYVHNVYDDDIPNFIDLNNGRILSWLNDDANIKIIEYYPEMKIIKSMNKYQLHNAGLISDKYIILMGLKYPQFDSWIMDTETYEIVKHWTTKENDSFMISPDENKFIYGSTHRIACDELIVKNGDFERKVLYESYYKEDKSEDWENSFGVREILDETTFLTSVESGRLIIFKCDP